MMDKGFGHRNQSRRTIISAMRVTSSSSTKELLAALCAGEELAESQTRELFNCFMHGQYDEAEAAAVLIALRMKGETASEIAAAARVLREHMVRWDPGLPGVLDTCGTGGDGTGTFNISTAAALVVAGCGVPVVKHGNRSVSSRSGSADVLAALGVKIEGDAEHARRCLHEAGLAFCFAPSFHPALKHIGPLRRRLGVPTIFNCLGPLANPAGATRQLLGVSRPEMLDPMSGALAKLGTAHAFIVCSHEGLDEVSLSAPTRVREVRGTVVAAFEWTCADFGLEACALSELAARDAAESARIILQMLQGVDGPASRIVIANAAAGLLAAERVTTLRDGVKLATMSLATGAALQVLNKLRDLSAESA
jgi:anthranilate phosphoribosyltransferase